MLDRVLVGNFEEYYKQLELERQWFDKYTLIRTGKLPSEVFNSTILPSRTDKIVQYGFEIKFMNMVCSLDTTNVNLLQAYQLWEKIRDRLIADSNQWIFNYINSLNSYIIYDIRHFIDDIISVCWVLKQPSCPTDVKIDSIGKYLGEENKGNISINDFDSFVAFFRKVNNFSNAYKHHFPNNMSLIYGRDEACIYAFLAKDNKNFLKPEMIGISLRELVEEFNKFYKYAFEVIAKYA